MNELQIFKNKDFGEVRTIEENGKALFVASDVARALGYKNTSEAIGYHCRGVVKRHLTDSLGRKQEANFIPEGDIYRLAAKSELPGADVTKALEYAKPSKAIIDHCKGVSKLGIPSSGGVQDTTASPNVIFIDLFTKTQNATAAHCKGAVKRRTLTSGGPKK
jgi:prophage antirepressor-like protein